MKVTEGGVYYVWSDYSPYIAPDGTTYPAQYDKALIPDLCPIREAPVPDTSPTGWTVDGQPRGGIESVTGWHMEIGPDGFPDQIWDTVARQELTEAESAEIQRVNRIGVAKSALQASDITVLRCYEAGIPLPPAWREYRQTLRSIVSGADIDVPVRPEYPE